MRGRGYFVTGIGTDVGKTYVSALLYKALNKKERVGYYKPIQSGCLLENEKIISPDTKFLADFNNISYDETMCSYYLLSETSPHLASEIQEVSININKILNIVQEQKEMFSHFIVEGAGGVYVPVIRDEYYIYNLIEDINFPVILVAGVSVGSINHTILTIKFLQSLNIEIQGIVFNQYKEGKEIFQDDNIKIIIKDSGINNYIIIKENQKEISNDDLEKLLKI